MSCNVDNKRGDILVQVGRVIPPLFFSMRLSPLVTEVNNKGCALASRLRAFTAADTITRRPGNREFSPRISPCQMSKVAKCSMIKDTMDVRLSIANATIFAVPSTKRGKTVVKFHSKAIDHAKLTFHNDNHSSLTWAQFNRPSAVYKSIYGLLKSAQLKINEDKVSFRWRFCFMC